MINIGFFFPLWRTRSSASANSFIFSRTTNHIMLNPHCNFPFIYVLFGVSSELVDFWTPKYVGKEWTDIGENDISFFFFF